MTNYEIRNILTKLRNNTKGTKVACFHDQRYFVYSYDFVLSYGFRDSCLEFSI